MRGHEISTAISDIRPVAMKNLQPGRVILVHVPFQDRDGYKTRPAVVMECTDTELRILPISSSENRHRRFGRELIDWARSDLSRPCKAMFDPRVVSRKLDVVAVRGWLSDRDMAACRDWWNTHEIVLTVGMDHDELEEPNGSSAA